MSVRHEDEIDRQKGIVVEMRKLNSKVIAERDEWRGLYEHGLEDRNALLAEIERRKAQLWKYGKHRATCALWTSMANPCTCGWVKVRETLAPVQQSPEDAINAAIAPQANPHCDPK